MTCKYCADCTLSLADAVEDDEQQKAEELRRTLTRCDSYLAAARFEAMRLARRKQEQTK